jgi:hypothetical protein
MVAQQTLVQATPPSMVMLIALATIGAMVNAVIRMMSVATKSVTQRKDSAVTTTTGKQLSKTLGHITMVLPLPPPLVPKVFAPPAGMSPLAVTKLVSSTISTPQSAAPLLVFGKMEIGLASCQAMAWMMAR